jgi:hypothetical protein
MPRPSFGNPHGLLNLDFDLKRGLKLDTEFKNALLRIGYFEAPAKQYRPRRKTAWQWILDPAV